ncbi:metallophosphoesterase [Uliginosibacterium gangwonense]|uniref:metallophosphoesterase n=1 Tax=Uliginosibacterium gangwonense TaxID=392736 RepID=UPI000369C92C|nr:metallophosphoesterase [Uliginosibacterium gangwonense]
MQIQILSDLHREFFGQDVEPCLADVVVLAGDIDIGNRGVLWAQETFIGTPVIYVCGNHEYYGKAYPKLLATLKDLAKGSNVFVLENDSVVLDGVRFLGCTLWTDFSLLGDPRIAGAEANNKMSDYMKIRVSPDYRRMRSIDTAMIHRTSREWLEQELAVATEKTVVVTHHAPSATSLFEGFQKELLSAAYASNLDGVVQNSQARLWVHGHIHSSFDYMLGDTRVISNPRGYPDERNEDFQADLVVEI